MGWSNSNEESRADHFIDERKHDWRPGDRGFEAASRDEPPARLDHPITTAEDIAICVRGMKNVADAASLIEKYAQMHAGIARADAAEDHRRRVSELVTGLARKEPSDAQA